MSGDSALRRVETCFGRLELLMSSILINYRPINRKPAKYDGQARLSYQCPISWLNLLSTFETSVFQATIVCYFSVGLLSH